MGEDEDRCERCGLPSIECFDYGCPHDEEAPTPEPKPWVAGGAPTEQFRDVDSGRYGSTLAEAHPQARERWLGCDGEVHAVAVADAEDPCPVCLRDWRKHQPAPRATPARDYRIRIHTDRIDGPIWLRLLAQLGYAVGVAGDECYGIAT